MVLQKQRTLYIEMLETWFLFAPPYQNFWLRAWFLVMFLLNMRAVFMLQDLFGLGLV